ncbi:MAG: ATP-dependent DNA helicase RecG [Elusimicrobia bacterium]|nr:ATP-dependent DNA helicase RecG [Elusimicrobiota bacterium]
MFGPTKPKTTLKSPVQYLKGVGPRRATTLAHLHIQVVEDLLFHVPRDWEDRRPPSPIVFKGRVIKTRFQQIGSKLSILKATLENERGEKREAIWFKRPSFRYDPFKPLKQAIATGLPIWIVGKPEDSLFPLANIRVEEFYSDQNHSSLHVGRIVPIYSLTEGIKEPFLRELIHQALTQHSSLVEDPLPSYLLQERNLSGIRQALQKIHFPDSWEERDAARSRLAYDEFLLLALAWAIKQRQTKNIRKGYGYEVKRHLLSPFREVLEFDLTQAQKRVINEIFQDMQQPNVMTRLLQGDVGSGKTVVALSALLLGVENGYQGAFMAPTEILAEQHLVTFNKFLKNLPVRYALLTSRTPPQKRAGILKEIAEGKIDIVIGTHALLEEDVQIPKLRIAVIDEQHRFGVRQRATLRQKGPPLDLLVMTATPIPRTLALALYGDLDVSTLDEMPPGRQPPSTYHWEEKQGFEQIRNEVEAGHQAYIVYPLIEESSSVDLKSAKKEFERLKNAVFPNLRVALVHGQMSGIQKTKAMEEFSLGLWDILVATPVIEVGVDVPNATTMIIQNADRFGLASLHQLRGRIGRGSAASHCVLVADPKNQEAEGRIRILCETTDGFKIGEEDLKHRGPGQILGTEQHGEFHLRVGNILKDSALLIQAREDAKKILALDPNLSDSRHQTLRRRLISLYQDRWHWIDLA